MTDNKTKKVTIRFSEEQHNDLLKEAKSSNMDLACYIREKIFFDIPQIEQNSFEFKMIKSISYCVGVLKGMMDLKLEDKDKEVISDEILRIMVVNGLKESQVKVNPK